MARYRSRVRRTVYVKPKKRWATNIIQYTKDFSGSETLMATTQVLVSNSVQASNPTPTILKAGNFKVQGDCLVAGTVTAGVITISLYVMYIPEGITIANASSAQNLINAHPEWIMAWKFISANKVQSGQTTEDVDAFSFSSRLKRNLNSGDSIQLIGLAAGNVSAVSLRGMAQYWTCAN